MFKQEVKTNRVAYVISFKKESKIIKKKKIKSTLVVSQKENSYCIACQVAFTTDIWWVI